MTNPVLNNDIATDSVILWQYDQAPNLINLIQSWNDFGIASCTKFWNYFGNYIFPIDRADTYGLNVWGNLLGIPRPTIKIPVDQDSREGGVDYVTIPDPDSGEADDRFNRYGYDENGYRVSWTEGGWKIVTIKNDLYRGLLKGRFFLMCHTPTVPNYNKYLAIVFGAKDTVGVQRDIFDTDGNIKAGYTSRCKAIDNQDMTMGFSFPTDATTEEAYLIFQHYDVVYPFPAGIRYPGAFVEDDLVIGLNTDQDVGQKYKNFVEGLVLVDDPNPENANGGIFSTTDGANYYTAPTVTGKAFVVVVKTSNAKPGITIEQPESSSDEQPESSSNARFKIWIDWGDGECGYHYLQYSNGSETITITKKNYYADTGVYAITVFYLAKDVDSVSVTDADGQTEFIQTEFIL